LSEIGLRATVGKCMMDSDNQVPLRLQERTQASIDESLALKQRWHGAANGRLQAAFAPRFAVSCSRDLLEAVASLSASEQALVHTHASETATKWKWSGGSRAASRTWSTSPRPGWQPIGSARRTVSGSPMPNRRCWLNATSR